MATKKALISEPEYEILRKSQRNKGSGESAVSVIIICLQFVLLVVLAVLLFNNWKTGNDDSKNKAPFNPPPLKDLAKTARYIAHYMDWSVISTVSTEFGGISFGCPVSVADGPVNNSTGIPYIYIAPATPTSKDLEKNASASLTFSESMSKYCSKNTYIAEDPRCARLTLLGKIVKLTKEEIPFAKQALFSRNPVMKDWPASHHFYFAKLVITHVHILDYFGPSHNIAVKDYFAAKV